MILFSNEQVLFGANTQFITPERYRTIEENYDYALDVFMRALEQTGLIQLYPKPDIDKFLSCSFFAQEPEFLTLRSMPSAPGKKPVMIKKSTTEAFTLPLTSPTVRDNTMRYIGERDPGLTAHLVANGEVSKIAAFKIGPLLRGEVARVLTDWAHELYHFSAKALTLHDITVNPDFLDELAIYKMRGEGSSELLEGCEVYTNGLLHTFAKGGEYFYTTGSHIDDAFATYQQSIVLAHLEGIPLETYIKRIHEEYLYYAKDQKNPGVPPEVLHSEIIHALYGKNFMEAASLALQSNRRAVLDLGGDINGTSALDVIINLEAMNKLK